MADNVTRLTLRTRIRELGEIREGGIVSDSRLNEEINQSIKALYDIVLDASPDYFESSQSISVVSGTASYALPTDYYKTLGVEVVRADGSNINLRRYNYADRNKYSTYGGNGVNREWTEYRIRGSNIIFVPSPNWSATVTHFYVPTAPQYAADGDSVDMFHGWDDYVVYDCLVKIIGGVEEGDASTWDRLKAETAARIMRMADVRDLAEPDCIRDLDEEEALRLWPRYGTPP